MNNKKRLHKGFSTRTSMLVLYLFLGITGVGMLVFSAWTPDFSVFSSEQTANPAVEHIPPERSADDETVTPAATLTPTLTPSPTVTPTSTPSPTPSPSPTPANPLVKNGYTEVNELIEDYYQANLGDDVEALTPLVSDISMIDMEIVQKKYSFIVSLKNFNCYTKKGIGKIVYIVYASFDSEIITINTPAPTLDFLTLVYAEDGSGTLRINMDALTDEENAYINELREQDDVCELYKSEEQRFFDALASDEALAGLYNNLNPSETVTPEPENDNE